MQLLWKRSEGVQNTLPQTMAPWNIKYSELKDFEKWTPLGPSLVWS